MQRSRTPETLRGFGLEATQKINRSPQRTHLWGSSPGVHRGPSVAQSPDLTVQRLLGLATCTQTQILLSVDPESLPLACHMVGFFSAFRCEAKLTITEAFL